MTKPLLVLSDNVIVRDMVRDALANLGIISPQVVFAFSPINRAFAGRYSSDPTFRPFDIKRDWNEAAASFRLIFSAHCKQIFPAALVNKVRCVNLHPGLLPWNRGWFPQVFAILEGLPLGATLHEIDSELDHGAILDREAVPLYPWDTSESAYARVLQAERTLLARSLGPLLAGTLQGKPPEKEGQIRWKRDFDALCELDLNATGTFNEFLNRLRALTHGEFRNAWFRAPDGGKVFVRVVLENEGHPAGEGKR